MFYDNVGNYFGAIGAAALNDHYLDGSIAGDMAIKSVSGGISLGTCVGGAPPCPTHLRIDASGNVGIGTTIPVNQLTVRSASPPDGIVYMGGNDGPATPNPHIELHGPDAGSPYIDFAAQSDLTVLGPPGSRDDFDARIGYDGPSDIFRVGAERIQLTDRLATQPGLVFDAATGNVGIGATTNPAAPNGLPGNLDANDVFVRSTNRWASQGNQFDFGGAYTRRYWAVDPSGRGPCLVPNPYTPGNCACPPGFNPAPIFPAPGSLLFDNDEGSIHMCFRN